MEKRHDSRVESKAEQQRPVIIFFVKIGQDLPQRRIEILRKCAQDLGAIVLSKFHPNRCSKPGQIPTHLVISELCCKDRVAKALAFSTADKFERFVQSHQIKCALAKWITNNHQRSAKDDTGGSKQLLSQLSTVRGETWLGLSFSKSRTKDNQPHQSQGNPIGGQPQVKKQRYDENNTTELPEASVSSSTVSSHNQNKKSPRLSHNLEISNLFLRLSKMHQACPLLKDDTWKAYMFHLVSGRLRHLPFDIRETPDYKNRLKAIPGIGPSSIAKIEEWLNTGTISRLEMFQTDPERVAMTNMMNIWGVGAVKASELVHQGYEDIAQVREALKLGKVTMERNQLIGVECYEDIMEEMGRAEVEAIGVIIAQSVRKRFAVPANHAGVETGNGVQVTIMGSYRRGKKACGDVDILISHPQYVKNVPPHFLGHLVEDLKERGHIAHHLTFLAGMKQPVALENADTGMATIAGSSKSYMGVFNSPRIKGRRRRVDIKFYPFRERVFASLYFTGNGHFNRSMRLWASRKYNATLNDHGVFVRNTTKRLMTQTPNSEKEVFDFLNLQYKEPHERDCFDAAISKDDIDISEQLEMNQADFFSDSKHTWIA